MLFFKWHTHTERHTKAEKCMVSVCGRSLEEERQKTHTKNRIDKKNHQHRTKIEKR